MGIYMYMHIYMHVDPTTINLCKYIHINGVRKRHWIESSQIRKSRTSRCRVGFKTKSGVKFDGSWRYEGYLNTSDPKWNYTMLFGLHVLVILHSIRRYTNHICQWGKDGGKNPKTKRSPSPLQQTLPLSCHSCSAPFCMLLASFSWRDKKPARNVILECIAWIDDPGQSCSHLRHTSRTLWFCYDELEAWVYYWGSPRVQSYIISLYDCVIKAASLSHCTMNSLFSPSSLSCGITNGSTDAAWLFVVCYSVLQHVAVC